MANSNTQWSLACLLAVVVFSSCHKKELPVKAHVMGNVTSASANMDQDYRWQLFYNIQGNNIVSKNLKTSWDLGFETSAEGYHVVLNGSRVMFAFNTGKTDMDAVVIGDTAGKKKWDSPTGHMDSTAFGDWRTGNVYIIDRGLGIAGPRLGYYKVQFLSCDNNKYKLRFAEINSTDITTVEIAKDTAYNLSFLSIEEKKQVMVEPPKTTWDFVFTQYTHTFTEPLQPYLVTGCVLNRYKTMAVLDTMNLFDNISANDIGGYTFSSHINAIGYDWKGFTGTTYVTFPKMNYVLHTRNGDYYKLHFVDFMEAGVKGNPKWEYQKL